MTEELTKISVICTKEVARRLMSKLFLTKEYIHWYEDNPTEEDLEMYEELKDGVDVMILGGGIK